METNIPPEYTKFESLDPFPSIPPALLNSADIYDYVDTVKIIQPFEPDRLKSASYDIPFEGEVHVWSDNEQQVRNAPKKTIFTTEKGGPAFILKPNSIVFLYLSACFYLPKYIAIRFNLKITHVHRGLLLGTGPIVDPGFCGRLLIPVHNLTANSYTLSPGEELIKVEFTKLSPNTKWNNSGVPNTCSGVYRDFPVSNRFYKPEKYFERSNYGNSIQSSIPDVGRDAKQFAQDAKSAAEKSARMVSILSGIGVLALAAILVSVYTLVNNAVKYVKDSKEVAVSAGAEVLSKSQVIERIEVLERELKVLRDAGKLEKQKTTAPATREKK